MKHIILADNQELTQAGLAAIINKVGSFEVTKAHDKRELLSLLESQPDSVVLLDYTLFDLTDVESLVIISERFPESFWLIISEDLTEEFMRKVIYMTKNIGIIFKDGTEQNITDAIREAVAHQRFVCQRATEILLVQHLREDKNTGLTCTETEILKNIAQGKTTKEIAAERYCSIHTINTHRKNIFRKLGVNTAHEAVKYAFRAGLIDTSEFYI